MIPKEILEYCTENLNDTILVESWGEKGIFYNPQNVLKRGMYISLSTDTVNHIISK